MLHIIPSIKIEIDDLRVDPAIIDWFRTIRPRYNTEISYLVVMKLYTDFIGKSPDELIKEAGDEAEYCMSFVPSNSEKKEESYKN